MLTGWPPPESFPVREILATIINEEWWHRQFAERDGRLPLADRLLDPLVDLVEVDVQVHQDSGGHSLTLPDEAEQDVLGPNVVVAELQSLTQ